MLEQRYSGNRTAQKGKEQREEVKNLDKIMKKSLKKTGKKQKQNDWKLK